MPFKFKTCVGRYDEARRAVPGKGLRCLAASVNLILHHNLTDLHTARSMFPSDGRCKTFDASADGFERGEGAGAVLMRPASEVLAGVATADEAEAQTRRYAASAHGSLAAAAAAAAAAATDDATAGDEDDDYTYAPEEERVVILVRGSSTIHKGGGASLRALRGPAIQHKVRAALADAAMSPHELKYIEASGLGEPYGDAVDVGAYQAVFEPNRDPGDKLVFGSVHTNIGHLDGCSGMASFIKTCLVAQHAAAPPVVHFKSLHPLMRGRSGTDTAQSMGHTWRDVNVNAFPSAFPMGLAPMFSATVAAGASGGASGGRPTCAAGVSSFGFGGTMAHVIVDGNGADTSRPPPMPLAFKGEVTLARPNREGRKKAQTMSEETMAYIENVVWQTLRACLGAKRKGLTRGGDFFDRDGAALTPHEARTVEDHLRERLRIVVQLVPVRSRQTAALG